MSKPDDLLFDKRLIHRHLDRGLITDAQVESRLAGLPDVADKASPLVADLTAVGVKHVKRERDVELAD